MASQGYQAHSASTYVGNVFPCPHENADIRLLLHARDSVSQGFNKFRMRTKDLYVAVLAVSTFILAHKIITTPANKTS